MKRFTINEVNDRIAEQKVIDERIKDKLAQEEQHFLEKKFRLQKIHDTETLALQKEEEDFKNEFLNLKKQSEKQKVQAIEDFKSKKAKEESKIRKKKNDDSTALSQNIEKIALYKNYLNSEKLGKYYVENHAKKSEIDSLSYERVISDAEVYFNKILDGRKNDRVFRLPVGFNVYFVTWLISVGLIILFAIAEADGQSGFGLGIVLVLFINILLHVSIGNLNERFKRDLSILIDLIKQFEKSVEAENKKVDEAHGKAAHEFVRQIDEFVEKEKQELKERLAAIEEKHIRQLGKLKVRRSDIELKFHEGMRDLEQNFELKKAEILTNGQEEKSKLERYFELLDGVLPRWEKTDYQNIIQNYEVVESIRFGKIYQPSYYDQEDIPAFIPFPFQGPVIYEISQKERKAIIKNIHSVLLRVLISFPATKARFIFIDPVGLGQNVGMFLNFLDYDERIIHHQAYHDTQTIDKLFEELIERMALITQKFLRNQYANLEAYNQIAGDMAEPNYFLIILDYPNGLREEMLPKLRQILTNGHVCGIYTLLMNVEPNTNQATANLINQISEAYKISKETNDNSLSYSAYNNAKVVLELPPQHADEIIAKVGSMCREAGNVTVPLSKLLTMNNIIEKNWWEDRPLSELQIPIGVIGSTKTQHLSFGKGTEQHLLIAGKTGSGKSSLLHTIITTTALKYSPEEVQLYLIDFKKGVEFKRYASSGLPHARVIAIESEREFGVSVLEGVDEEMQRRGVLFRSMEVENFKEFRTKTNEKLARILLIIDEYQEFFSVDSDMVTLKVTQILDRLVRQGRAFGIHLILGSQTIAGSYNLSRSTIDQIAIRIALQCSEDDSRLILSNDNPAARMLSRPGEAIYNAMNGRTEGNYIFQVAWPAEEEQQYYLGEVKALATKHQVGLVKPIIFEGNDVSKLEESEVILNLIENGGTGEAKAYIGEPISIKESTSINFKPQSGSNLMVLGQDLMLAQGIIFSVVMNLALNLRKEKLKLFLLDFTPTDSPFEELIKVIAEKAETGIVFGRRSAGSQTVETVYGHLQQAKDAEIDGHKPRQSVFLLLNGIQRYKDLEADGYGSIPGISSFESMGNDQLSTKPDINKMIKRLLEEGPDYHIYTIIWSDNYKNLTRRIGRQLIREFDMKVMFRLSTEDSVNVNDNTDAAKLKANHALYYNEDTGISEKFKPFGMPEKYWLVSNLVNLQH